MRVNLDFDLSFKTNIASKFAAQQRGRRERRRDLWRHAGPSGDLLLRMPTQLHSLSENMRAPAWLLALALQLQELPGSLPSHYAVSLVGGAHVRYRIRKHFEGVGKSFFFVCFCLYSFRRTPEVCFLTLLCMQIFLFWGWLQIPTESHVCLHETQIMVCDYLTDT